MDLFSSKRLISVILALLVVLNLALLGFLLWQNFYQPEKEVQQDRTSRKTFFQEELRLSDEQNRRFNALRKEHFRGSIPVFIHIAAQKKQLIDEAFKETPDVEAINTLAERIGKNQAILERRLAWHFHSLATVCTPEQKDSLRTILESITIRPRITAKKITSEPADTTDSETTSAENPQ
ncbi:MAG: periplasmic heavy metal sensor [Prosthecochloris sp.]|nr:periplasmic heavy metal sensor [Prosthecochloris sp.]